MEEAFMETERRFQNVVELTNDWVWGNRTKSQVYACTYGVPDFLGYTPEEALGKTPLIL